VLFSIPIQDRAAHLLFLARAQPSSGCRLARSRGGFGDTGATASGDAEALLESRSDLRRLDQLIEALPAPLRETIVLRELHELGYREIAEVTGVPIGTVMSRLHRARSLLLLRAHYQTGDAAAASAALPG
jgi:RNA polymerase sigma factor (sigma-70 family)